MIPKGRGEMGINDTGGRVEEEKMVSGVDG